MIKKDVERLQKALINIRDYYPPHCRGDHGCQSDCIQENTDEQLDNVVDLLPEDD